MIRRPPRSTLFPYRRSSDLYVLRGGSEVRAAAESALGCGIPARACRATVEGDRAALWLGPDEWLLIAPEPPPRRVGPGPPGGPPGAAPSPRGRGPPPRGPPP